MAKTAFAVAAHPDDIEFFMAGTLVLLKEAGYEIHYMNISNGSCGTTQFDTGTIIETRREEGKKAAAFIGAVFHESLVNDIEIFYEKKLLARLAAIFRESAPEILLIHSPSDYMEDHTNACRLAVTAAFVRGMRNFPTDPQRSVLENEVTLYHAQPHGNRDGLRRLVRPGLYVNVDSVLEKKTDMLACHQSQKRWLDESQGMDSYLQAMKDFTAEVGTMSGRYPFAEGWRRHRHLGFCGENADPLLEALKGKAFVDESYEKKLDE